MYCFSGSCVQNLIVRMQRREKCLHHSVFCAKLCSRLDEALKPSFKVRRPCLESFSVFLELLISGKRQDVFLVCRGPQTQHVTVSSTPTQQRLFLLPHIVSELACGEFGDNTGYSLYVGQELGRRNTHVSTSPPQMPCNILACWLSTTGGFLWTASELWRIPQLSNGELGLY